MDSTACNLLPAGNASLCILQNWANNLYPKLQSCLGVGWRGGPSSYQCYSGEVWYDFRIPSMGYTPSHTSPIDQGQEPDPFRQQHFYLLRKENLNSGIASSNIGPKIYSNNDKGNAVQTEDWKLSWCVASAQGAQSVAKTKKRAPRKLHLYHQQVTAVAGVFKVRS